MTSASPEAADWPGTAEAAAKSDVRQGRKLVWLSMAAILGLGLFAAGIYQLASVFRGYALDAERQAAQSRLELIAVGLSGELAKFETVAEILAGDDRFLSFLQGHESVSIDAINGRLEEVRAESDALDVYLMDRSGMTLAASNWNQEVSFVGRDFAYRPYFQDAIAGGLGKFFAVGTTSHLRGYYFAYPVLDSDQAIGVVTVKMQIDHLETIWKNNGNDVLVSDANGIVFMASDPRWRLRSLRPIVAGVRLWIRQTRQYPELIDELIPIEEIETLSPRDRIIRLSDAEGGTSALRLMQERPMPQAGWTLILLSDLKAVDQAVLRNTVLVAACAVALFGLLWVALERHRRVRDRLAGERQHRGELEALVDERTEGLQKAYEELRNVQDQLVLSSRFAVMGRLSAGLSHEINQPLTAIGAHLDNAKQLIARDRVDEARERLADIHRLTARITTIVRQLKSLAHGSSVELRAIPLRRAVETAMTLLAAELSDIRVDLHVDEPSPVHVMAEPVLLEQVFVNLLSNAAQALGDMAEPCITIRATPSEEWVEVVVADNGPGIDPARLDEIFEPFVTTRSGRGGLGLGLTIVQDTVVRFGGRIRARNRTDGQGLVVTLHLKPPPD